MGSRRGGSAVAAAGAAALCALLAAGCAPAPQEADAAEGTPTGSASPTAELTPLRTPPPPLMPTAPVASTPPVTSTLPTPIATTIPGPARSTLDQGPARTQGAAVVAGSPQLAGGYFAPVARIADVGQCLDLTYQVPGKKVNMVQVKLGLPASTKASYEGRVITLVRQWEKAHGLVVDGVVDAAQWRQMGFTVDFCSVDHYNVQPAVDLRARSAQRIEQMIKFAMAQRGKRYVWGGSGALNDGYDCSGLVIQSLHSAGLDPVPYTSLMHQARAIYADPRFLHLPLNQVRRGDLVFWADSTGTVVHMGIATGPTTTIESADGGTRTGRLVNRNDRYLMPALIRPFP